MAGFKRPSFDEIDTIEEAKEIYDKYIEKIREELNYEIDGLVLVANSIEYQEKIETGREDYPEWAIAWKFPNEGKETIVTDIEWNVSRHGNLVPVAIFEPIDIGSTTIQRATLNNVQNVITKNIKIGDNILVEKANDVIPFIKTNLGDVGLKFPTNVPRYCSSCQSKLVKNSVHLTCPNHKDCPEQHIQKIIFWVKQCDMDGVSESTIRTLFEKGLITEIKDLYNLVSKNFLNLEGFGTKRATNFLMEIDKTRDLECSQFIKNLGISLVGKKAVKKLGIKSITEFKNFNDPTYVIGQKIIEWKSDPVNMKMLEELLEVITVKMILEVSRTMKIAMTGKYKKGRKELIKDIEAKGHEFSSSVTKDTNILLCEDPNGTSSKLQKARKLGVALKSYSEYFTE